MDTWTVSLSPNVNAQLQKLPGQLAEAALAFIELFVEDPFPPDSIRLTGYNDLYRVHLDGWRIVYRVNRRRRLVRIERIRPRAIVYRGLEPRM